MIERNLHARVLVDVGPLVAIFRERDWQHATCIETLNAIMPPMLTSWPVITEAAYLLRDSAAGLQKLLAGPTDGLYRILPLAEDDMPAIAALLRKYRMLATQLADASLAYLAQREGLDTVFTLDRRDFSVLRCARNRPFRLLPETS